MQLRTTLVILLLSITFAQRSTAQGTQYDSLGLNKIVQAPGVDNPEATLGFADGQEVHVTGSLGILARYFVNEHSLTFQKGATIHIHWRRQSNNPPDSNVGLIHLQRLSEDFRESGDTTYQLNENLSPANEVEMTSIVVPDTGFNAIAIECDALHGGNSLWLDAIVLLQSGTAGVTSNGNSVKQLSVLSNYPNPFPHSASTLLHITSPETGQGLLFVTDMLGREVIQLPLGNLEEGGQDVKLILDHAGTFFTRLRINGTWVGVPLKITAE